VLLSVSADKTLKCWDLTRGLLSYSLTLNRVPIQVKWFLDDIHFCISFDNMVEIHSIETGVCVHTISLKSRINSITTSIIKGQQVVIMGGEDKMVRIYCLDGSLLASFDSTHSLRIKSMDILDSLLVTCGSDGTIFVWDLVMLDDIKPIQEYNAKCRLTCIGICKARKYEKEEELVHEYPESDYEDVVVKKQKITVSFEKSDQKKKRVK
jgi:WD40 repeat protein